VTRELIDNIAFSVPLHPSNSAPSFTTTHLLRAFIYKAESNVSSQHQASPQLVFNQQTKPNQIK
jgi:hypothetical protein